MSTLSSISGMLPLAVAPGPFSQIYRGLGSIIIRELLTSSIFVVFIISFLLMVVIRMGN